MHLFGPIQEQGVGVLLQEIIMEFFWKEGVAIWSIF